MKQFLALTILLLSAANVNAELIFDIQLSNTTVTIGDEIIVTIRIRSESEVTIGGYTANLLAGLGDGSGGTFTQGFVDFSVGDPNEFWDFSAIQGQAFITTDTSNGTGLGASLPANQIQVLGRLTLDTSGATVGSHQFSMDSLAANDLNGFFLDGAPFGARFDPAVSVFEYSVTAVPEPSALWLFSSGIGGALVLRRARCGRLTS